jgi:hypothetical protein
MHVYKYVRVRADDSDYTTAAQLRQNCAQALLTIAKMTNSQAPQVCAALSPYSQIKVQLLWPYLFEYVCMDTYSPVVIDICKTLVILAENRRQQDGDGAIVVNMADNRECAHTIGNICAAKLPGAHQVLARLFVLMSTAQQQRCTVALDLLLHLSPWFHASVFVESAQWREQAGKLRMIIEGVPCPMTMALSCV